MSSILTSLPLAAATDRRVQELREIEQALRGLQYGTVTVIVQDGVVVQIDRTEKRRLARQRTEEANQ